MGETELAVRAGANAQVVAKLPVVQVVKALVAVACVSRDFVAVQAAPASHVGDQVQHGASGVVLGNHRRKFGEKSVGLDGELVNGNVRRVQAERHAHVLCQAVQRLAWQGVHDVQVEGVKGLGGFFNGGNRLRAVMHPAQGFEVPVVETLHPDRQARDTGAAKGAETVFLEGAGIGFQGDLAIGLQAQARADVTQQAVDRLRRKQAGGASADEDAVDCAAPNQGQRALQVGHQRVDVALFGQICRRHLVRIEIAIRAFFEAPRQMHIERQGRQGGELQRAGPHVVPHIAQRSRCLMRLDRDHDQRSRISATMACAAWPRWLMAFLTSTGSCANVLP